jgi:hypothetical protein
MASGVLNRSEEKRFAVITTSANDCLIIESWLENDSVFWAIPIPETAISNATTKISLGESIFFILQKYGLKINQVLNNIFQLEITCASVTPAYAAAF